MLLKLLNKNLLIGFACTAFACSSSQEQQAATAEMKEPTPAFTAEQVNNKKDPVCGMPVKSGISDTAHYKDKVFGFCSPECKKAFSDSSDIYLSQMN